MSLCSRRYRRGHSQYPDLHGAILSALEQSILQGAHSPFNTLFDFYRTLAQGWSQHIVAAPKNPAAIKAYLDLLDHVSILAQSALAANDSSSSAILSFYETVVDSTLDAVSKRISIPVIGPPPQIFYLFLMASSTSDLSRICSIIVKFKEALTKKAQLGGLANDEAEAVNSILMDVCNLLWRSKALELASVVSPTAKGCLCSAEVTNELQAYLSSLHRDYRVQMIFGLSYNAAISSIAHSSFVALQDEAEAAQGESLKRHVGPVTQKSLEVLAYEGGMKINWQNCRVSMLNWMEVRGLDGIKTLLFATIKNLTST
jgi:centromere protein I